MEFQFTVETYDISKGQCKYVKSVSLMKDKDNALVKKRLLLKRASFITNGKLMLMIYRRKMNFFDLATGVLLAKAPLNDGLKLENDGVVTYDLQNHRLWYLDRKQKDLYSFISPNFKRVVKEES